MLPFPPEGFLASDPSRSIPPIPSLLSSLTTHLRPLASLPSSGRVDDLFCSKASRTRNALAVNLVKSHIVSCQIGICCPYLPPPPSHLHHYPGGAFCTRDRYRQHNLTRGFLEPIPFGAPSYSLFFFLFQTISRTLPLLPNTRAAHRLNTTIPVVALSLGARGHNCPSWRKRGTAFLNSLGGSG